MEGTKTSAGAAAPDDSPQRVGSTTDYTGWSHAGLIERIMDLEGKLKEHTSLYVPLIMRPPPPLLPLSGFKRENKGLRETRARTDRSQVSRTEDPTATANTAPPKHSRRVTGSDSAGPSQRAMKLRDIDSSKYSTRMIALKVAYIGKKYYGFADGSNHLAASPLPTIERELWRALRKTRLIFPRTGARRTSDMPKGEAGIEEELGGEDGREGGDWKEEKIGSRKGDGEEGDDMERVDWTGCDYSGCGRTDKGVSAFGQVVGVRVRSNRPLPSVPETEDAPLVNSGQEEGQETVRAQGEPRTTEEVENEEDDGGRTSSVDQSQDPALPEPQPRAPNNGVNGGKSSSAFDPIRDELPYIKILNRALPDDIRVLAWCPSVPENFSARFACTERRYRYFFTQPAFLPMPFAAAAAAAAAAGSSSNSNPSGTTQQGQHGEEAKSGGEEKPQAGRERNEQGWLNIDAMRQAARSFVGYHDVRNFCKLDTSKQITDFRRRIFYADIVEVDPSKGVLGYSDPTEHAREADASDAELRRHPYAFPPRVYSFVVHGSGFLWHQVRHMVAVLFLIGQRLESPSLVAELLDTAKLARKPRYHMADEAPLVLWECIFPGPDRASGEDGLEWVYDGENGGVGHGESSFATRRRHDQNGLWERLWKMWRGRKMDEILTGSLFDALADADRRWRAQEEEEAGTMQGRTQQTGKMRLLFEGRDSPRTVGRYVPVMDLPRLDPVEDVNRRYALRKSHVLVEKDPEE